jgi:kinesin family protein 5
LAAHEKIMADMRDEVAYLKEQESTTIKVSSRLIAVTTRADNQENQAMSSELNTLRVSAGRLEAESKDVQILVDSYKERISELQKDIEDHKTQIEELKHAQAKEKEEEKEKRKQEMLNDMMSRIDMVSYLGLFTVRADNQGGQSLDSSSEKLRELFKEIETSREGSAADLTVEAKELIRVHLTENQDLVRDLQDRLRMAQEESELQAKRRMDVEKMLIKRETAYEELLDRTASNQSMAVEDIKVSSIGHHIMS